MAEKVARYPEVAFLRHEFGNLLARRGRLREALRQFEIAVELEPDSARVWNNIGVVRQALGRGRGAVRAYRKALRIAPSYALAYYNLGVAYDASGKYDKALDSYQTAIELDPELLDPRKNPQVASNRHLAVVILKSYIGRGGSVVLPLESAYPDPLLSEPSD
ncbi:MAG: tetratricopeptide repeat protein [Acidobacteriota bacterium]